MMIRPSPVLLRRPQGLLGHSLAAHVLVCLQLLDPGARL